MCVEKMEWCSNCSMDVRSERENDTGRICCSEFGRVIDRDEFQHEPAIFIDVEGVIYSSKHMAAMKKTQRATMPKPYLEVLSTSTGSSLIRYLASCNASVRFESLRLIQSWLSSSPNQITDDEMIRLWKGLFYCLCHSDKAPSQAQLINRLSSLLLSLDPLLSLKYFNFFFVTLRREWNGIDHFRIDKFYLLIRRFVNAFFCLMGNIKWDYFYLKKYVEVLENKVMGTGVGNSGFRGRLPDVLWRQLVRHQWPIKWLK